MSGVKVPKCLNVNKLKQKDIYVNLTEWLDCLEFEDICEKFETKFIQQLNWFYNNKTVVSQLLERKEVLYINTL